MAENDSELQEIYVLVAKTVDGLEGIATYIDPRDGVMKPGIGSSRRLPDLVAIGQALANESGRPVTVTQWSQRKNCGELSPAPKDKG